MVELSSLWLHILAVFIFSTLETLYIMSDVLFESNLQSLKLIAKGKVRDIYAVDDEHLLIVTTDRLSAFDVILPNAIPGKGRILTQISRFWFEKTQHIIQNHLSDMPLEDVLSNAEIKQLNGRGMIVKKLNALPIEAVVRGYLIGSGWKDYQNKGQVCGITLPSDLQLAQQLPETIYTPATKAEVGDHDENISFEETCELVGNDIAQQVKDVATEIYTFAADYARKRGIIIADTKFEFGLNAQGELTIIDEALTPDSSRFWPTESYQVGTSPTSFDKQFVRDYLETLDWDKVAPGPELPEAITQQTADKYAEALTLLTK